MHEFSYEKILVAIIFFVPIIHLRPWHKRSDSYISTICVLSFPTLHLDTAVMSVDPTNNKRTLYFKSRNYTKSLTILKVNYIFQHERGLILCITRTSQKRLSATQKQQLGALPYSIQD